jgi:hypothetical protein
MTYALRAGYTVPSGLMRIDLSSAALFACVSLLALTGQAQTAEQLASRRLLIDQATTAAAAGDNERALELAERAQRIQSTPSIRLFIAARQEALGRFVAALGTADQCVRDATRDTTVPNRQALLDQCAAITTRARGHVGVLVLRVAGSTPTGLVVTLNGAAVSEALIGASQLVQEGTVRITATAPGFTAWERSITVRSSQTESVEITLERGSDSVDSSTSSAATASIATSGPSRTRVERRGPGAGPWIIVGVGGATLALSGVFFALRGAALSNCTVGAQEILCDTAAQAQRVRDEAYTYNALTNVSIGVGAAMVAGGVLWFALAPRRTVEVTVAGAGRDGVGLSARGQF